MRLRTVSIVLGLFASSCTPDLVKQEATDPGTVTLHRLNRAELNNTWRDLLGATSNLADEFPSDDSVLGFDNIADSLSTSPLHFEMLETATDQLLLDVIPNPISPVVFFIEAESDSTDIDVSVGGGCCGGEAYNVWSRGQLGYTVTLPYAGEYTFRVALWGQQAGEEWVQAEVGIDETTLGTYEIEATSQEDAEIIEVSVTANAGEHRFYVAFLNDYYQNGEDRNMIVDWLEVSGPQGEFGGPPANYDRLFSCEASEAGEATCTEEIARTFGAKAWRRPLTDDEVSRLLTLYQLSRDSGGTYDEGVGLMAKALMLSPHFYYRVELDPAPTDPTTHPLNPWELASRLSYFLWSSMPDAELFAAAADESLLDDEVLEAQVRRMLADEKAAAIVDNLAGQWLHIRAMDDALPDVWYFPDWDEPLRASMKEEMRRMATRMFMEDRSMLDLLTAEETEIDDRLATYYGLERTETSDWETVSLVETERMGWITTGGLLTLTSYPTRTSPVKRGKWVLSNLLCEAPAPPPDNVDAVLNTEEAEEGESLVEQLERHRADPVCASCHQTMDPIGLGLENFDGIGMWRDTDEVGNPIDAAGQLSDGYSFSTPRDLAQHIAEDPKFTRCIAMKTMTYGLGRGLTVEDWPFLERIEDDFAASDYRFADLVVAITASDVFRTRRGQEDTP